MNWETMTSLPTPDDYGPTGIRNRRSTCTHVRVQGDTSSLCGKACLLDPQWQAHDEHPEDVDPDDRCSVCYSVFERTAREEAGREGLPSNYLSWERGPRATRRSAFTFSEADFA